MNRPGQPPQRPPNLTPTQGLGGPFRGPFPTGAYAAIPRNPMPHQGYPAMPTNHRTNQNIVLQSPGFMQRNQASFPFGATIQPHQAQQQQQPPIQHTQPPQQQQQPLSSNTPSNLPSLLSQNNQSNLGTASVSSTSDVGLDPNDFPALGSGSTGTSNANPASSPATGLASTYASQAGTGVPIAGGPSTPHTSATGSAPGAMANSLNREFTNDDFPALPGPQQDSQDHPPGLNGFGQSELHRQSALGPTQGSMQTQQQQSQTQQQPQPPQQQPGLLNLSAQQRNVHPGFQTDTEKRLNAFPSGVQNGVPLHTPQNHLQQPQSHMNAPPGVPSVSPYQPQSHPTNHAVQGQQQYATNSNDGQPTQTGTSSAVPQTAAQQVLMSPADRWGLLGLLSMIKNSDADGNLLSVGTDLGTMGLDMQHQGNLYSTFITPWSDSSAAHSVEPDFHLPTCYNVHPPPPGPTKAAAFSEETLFYMFYSSPRDALQEVAAQELWNRNWRYHKELRLWLTKEAGTRPSTKIDGGEHGTYTFWDPDNWEKQRKDLTVMYAELEEKAHPVFTGPTITPLQAQSPQGQNQQQAGQQAQHGALQTQVPQIQQNSLPRAGYQGMGLASVGI